MTPKTENLIVKYITKSASATDLDTLSNWIKEPTNKQEFKDYVQTHYAITYSMNNPDSKKVIKNLLHTIRKEKSLVYRLKKAPIFKYAAAIILAVLASTYFLKNNTHKTQTNTAPIIVNRNIKVGKDKATLTLEDGSVIALEKDKTYQSDHANSNGKELIYNTTNKKKHVNNTTKQEIAYNHLTIPRGGQFYVKLPDGTEVWLNSESKLKYPVAFIEGATREVELIYGEAYFDVSPSTDHNGSGFKVINQGQEVKVIGTEFNIKAYKEEHYIYTTLIEGSVTVNNFISEYTLEPNQQSRINIQTKDISINAINIYSETSWRKGIFSFKSKTLKEIMVVLSRWYNVDVVFANAELENVKFNGVLSKNDKIEETLETIKNTNFINAYDIKDNQIILK